MKKTIFIKILVVCMILCGLFTASNNKTKTVFASEEAPQITKVGGEDVVGDSVSFGHIIVGDTLDLELEITGSGTIDVYFSRKPEGCSWLGLTEDNHLQGTVTKAGNYGVNVTAKNEFGSHAIIIWFLIFNEGDVPVITTESLPNAYVNSKYLQYIEFTGYNQSFDVSVEGADWLKSYDSGAYGAIEGTPTIAGNYVVTVSIDNGAGIAKKNYSLSVLDETLAPEIKPELSIIKDDYSSLDSYNYINVVEGKAVNVQLFATGTNTGTNPLVWSLADGSNPLPTGLSISSNGLLSGTVETGFVASGQCKYSYFSAKVYNYKADGVTKQTHEKNLCVVVWKDQIITNIEVPSTEITVSKGGKRQLSATVIGYGDFDSTVVWSLGTKDSENTTINENGLLTIGADETKEQIFVYARPKADNFYSAEITVNISEHSHLMSYVPAVKETCTTNGNITHYVCETCGLKFSDADAINELTDEQIVIPAHHTFGEWISNGEGSHTRICRDCALSETESCSGGSADCQHAAVCVICAGIYGGLGLHQYGSTWDYTNEEGHAYCCTVSGCTEHDSINPHTFGEDNICTECGYEKHVHNAALGAAWLSDDNTHWHSCSGCSEKVDVGSHAYGEWTISIQPQVGVEGQKERACDICGHKEFATVAALKEQVTINVVGGLVNGSTSITVDKNTSVTVVANETPEGKTFEGWSLDGGETIISQETSYTFDLTDNITITAVYKKIPSKGLSGGAIAGIVIGGVAVIGVAGFSLFWFVIKKKTFADLLTIFTKK